MYQSGTYNGQTNMNANITNVTCKTRVNETDKNKVETKLELDWEGVERDSLIEWATKAVVIAWQATARKAGTIPASDTVSVLELGNRTRTKATPAQRANAALAGMDDDALAALEARIAALRAGK